VRAFVDGPHGHLSLDGRSEPGIVFLCGGVGVAPALSMIREAAARGAGAAQASFCAVVRPDDHPMRPDGPRDLAPFWRARGYAPVAGLTAMLNWQELGQAVESPHQMQFWMRDL
jgi:hypothetical protein